MHSYPDHRIIPDGASAKARDEIAKIDEEFAQLRNKLSPLMDRYVTLSLRREELCGYTIPQITPEETEVIYTRAKEMLRMDPDAYLAPVVRVLLAVVDSLEFHSVSAESEPYKEMAAFFKKHHPDTDEEFVPTLRSMPMDYSDPRRR